MQFVGCDQPEELSHRRDPASDLHVLVRSRGPCAFERRINAVGHEVKGGASLHRDRCSGMMGEHERGAWYRGFRVVWHHRVFEGTQPFAEHHLALQPWCRSLSATGAFAQAIAAKQLSPELARLPNIVPLAGGLTIEAGGGVVGAIGVSGAPGGDKDEACARAGLEAVGDKLEF